LTSCLQTRFTWSLTSRFTYSSIGQSKREQAFASGHITPPALGRWRPRRYIPIFPYPDESDPEGSSRIVIT